MKNRWGWLPLAACMLAFVTAPAAAQLGNIRSFPDGYWNVGSKDKVDASGNQYTREAYPLSALKSFGTCVPSQTVGAGATVVGTPFLVDGFSIVNLYASWGRATYDSLALDIYPLGKISQAAADGYDYLMDIGQTATQSVGHPCWGVRFLPTMYPTVADAGKLAPVMVPMPKGFQGWSVAGPWNKEQFVAPLGHRFVWMNVAVTNRSATARDSVSVEYLLRGN